MEIYRDNRITLSFSENEDGNEIRIVKSVFNKFDEIAKKPGYKKDFSPDEIDLISKTREVLNKMTE